MSKCQHKNADIAHLGLKTQSELVRQQPSGHETLQDGDGEVANRIRLHLGELASVPRPTLRRAAVYDWLALLLIPKDGNKEMTKN
jgi:hypothetical protein